VFNCFHVRSITNIFTKRYVIFITSTASILCTIFRLLEWAPFICWVSKKYKVDNDIYSSADMGYLVITECDFLRKYLLYKAYEQISKTIKAWLQTILNDDRHIRETQLWQTTAYVRQVSIQMCKCTTQSLNGLPSKRFLVKSSSN